VSAPDQAAREALVAQWSDFCERMKREGEGLLSGARGELSSQEIAEGVRHLARQAVYTLQTRVEFGDPDFPRFHRVCDDRISWGAPHNDNTYLVASLRPDATYVIRGHLHGRVAVWGKLWSNAPHFMFEPDGGFRITLSAEPAEGNWIKLEPNAPRGDEGLPGPYPGLGGRLMLKIYHEDWGSEAPQPWMTIERVDAAAPTRPEPLRLERLTANLQDAGELFTRNEAFYDEHQELMHGMVGPNELAPPVPAIIPNLKPGVGTEAPLVYGFGWFELGDDEALLVESEVPQQGQWAFQLYSRWYEAVDFQNRQSSVNKRQAYIDSDGLFRAVVAAEDPGAPNWLDTGGLQRGWLLYRWLKTEIRPTARARLVRTDELSGLLPADHPKIAPQERARAVKARAVSIARRFQQ